MWDDARENEFHIIVSAGKRNIYEKSRRQLVDKDSRLLLEETLCTTTRDTDRCLFVVHSLSTAMQSRPYADLNFRGVACSENSRSYAHLCCVL